MKEATDWLKWISGWTTLSASIDFPFQSPKLSRESSFTLSLDYAGLCKERSSKQVTDNFQRRALFRKIVETLKKINFQFDHCKFSEQRNSILSYYYRRVTRWGRRVSLLYFFESWKKVPWFWEKVHWFRPSMC